MEVNGEMGQPPGSAEESMVLGVGVLGYGFMGRAHTYSHLSIPLHYDPPPLMCRLRSVCVRRSESGEAALRAGSRRWTTDPQELIEATDVDIIHICTPNHLHRSALEAAVGAGCGGQAGMEPRVVVNWPQNRPRVALGGQPGWRSTGGSSVAGPSADVDR